MSRNIESIREILKASRNIEFAYLFGSRAKGIAGQRSDWDIAIYFDKDPRNMGWSIFYLEAEVSKDIGEEVQIVALNNLNSPVFLFEIINSGLLIIDNNPEGRILFEANVLRNYHDWHYFLKRQMQEV
ncbi:MAG: nucleotidyltransferase domain-containing protein [Nitrospirae bacterium]|nr:nucleotidyltransferase domain-containing protein [Nitrospirota bacterium]